MLIKPGEELIRTVNIDESIGRDTTFAFEYTRSPTVVIEVISPSGKRYTLYGPNRYSPYGAKVIGVRIKKSTRVSEITTTGKRFRIIMVTMEITAVYVTVNMNNVCNDPARLKTAPLQG